MDDVKDKLDVRLYIVCINLSHKDCSRLHIRMQKMILFIFKMY